MAKMTSYGAKSPPPKVSCVALLAFSETSQAAILGLCEMWTLANTLGSEDCRRSILFETLSHSNRSFGERVFDAIVIPPLSPDGRPTVGEQLRAWLHLQSGAGSILCSACGGAMILAETGLLDGRKATTHWSLREEVHHRFPKVEFDLSKVLIDEGDILTAGGVMSWTQLGLRIIERFLGTDVMRATAKFMAIDPADRPQSYYASFTPNMKHGDLPIVAVQKALHQELWKNATLDNLVLLAGMTKRTFLRRFFKATNMTPTEYCQRLRIEHSREMLEKTSVSIDQIAYESGYDDPNFYRKIFKRELGITPGEYRSRLGIRALLTE